MGENDNDNEWDELSDARRWIGVDRVDEQVLRIVETALHMMDMHAATGVTSYMRLARLYAEDARSLAQGDSEAFNAIDAKLAAPELLGRQGPR